MQFRHLPLMRNNFAGIDRRKELKMTQRQLAEKLGREQSYIARVERGKADIQLSSFFRIAAVLGIQLVPTYLPMG